MTNRPRHSSAPLRDDDAMTLVFVKKVETLDDPGVEAAADVLSDFLHDVAAVLEPLKFRARRYREDGLFAFFAVISVAHRPARSRATTKKPPRPVHRRPAFVT